MAERITDPKALRALSHPTRWKLIELLGLEPAATATRCAEFTGESVGHARITDNVPSPL